MVEASLPNVLAQRFQVSDRIATGQAGTTYRVTEIATQRVGALKVIDAARGWTAAERGRLGRELEKLATLKHPYLAEVYATGVADELPWIFRVEVEGESLRAKIEQSRQSGQPYAGALHAIAQLSAALDEVHRAGLLQRDLSPEHVIVRSDGTVGLIDTGVAVRIASASVFEIAGKPAYVSPEHATGKLVSFRSDLYALGCMLFEMLTGAPPFVGTADQVLEAHRSKPAPALEGQPQPVTALVAQLLQKDPRDRPFSAQQVRRTLEPLTGALSVPQSKPQGGGTLLGLAAVSAAPRADATEHLNALDVAKMALAPVPPQPKPPPRADGTEQLSALDLARAEALVAPKTSTDGSSMTQQTRTSVPPPPPGQARRSVPPPPPPRASAAPPSSPGLAVPPPPSGAIAVPPAPQSSAGLGVPPAPPSAPVAVQGPSSQELDYDDFAETKAVSRDMVNELRALGGLDAIDPNLQQAPGTAPTMHAQAPQGFGQQPQPQQGFGGQPQPQGFGGAPAPAQQGFGAPASSGFGGAPAPAQQGFGAPSSPGGFGAPAPSSPGGFGAPAPSSPGGFGAPSSAGAFGAPAQQGFAAQQQPAYTAPAQEPKKSRAGLWIALGLISFCGVSSVAGAAGTWFLDVGGVQTQVLAAVNGPLPTGTPPAIVPIAPPPTVAVAPPPIVPTAPTTPTTPTAPAVVMYHATIASNPPGAQISVDGTPRGAAPVTVDVPRDSMVRATATMDGYYESSMSMQAVSDLTMTITLQQRAVAAVATTTPTTTSSGSSSSGSSGSTSSGSSGSTSSGSSSSGSRGTSGSSSSGSSGSTSSGSSGSGSSGGLATGIRPATGGSTTGTTTTTSGSSSGGTGLASSMRPGTTTTGTTTTGTTTSGTTTSGTGAPRLASGLRPGGTTTTGSGTASGGTASGGTASGGTTAASGGGGGTASVDDLRAQARAHFQARRYREAAQTYEQATRLAPTNVNLWSGLGAARLQAGDNAGAVTAYQRAVQLAPTTAAYHAALGRAYFQSGNRTSARTEWERALQLDPNNADARTGMSRL